MVCALSSFKLYAVVKLIDFAIYLEVFADCLHCLDTVGWTSGRAFGLWKI